MSNPSPINVKGENAEAVAFVLAKFLEPFDDSEIKLKPAMVKGNRCLALAYIDARLVTDRLDEVVGMNNWKDEYTLLPTGEVECRLSVRVCGEWITKADVGGQSEQPDEGDKMKAAYSDALKRAAVKFGIGRFLYRRPQQWMDYDPAKKRIIRSEESRQHVSPQPAPSQSFPPRAQVRDAAWVAAIVARVRKCVSAADGVPIWREYDAENKRGAVRPDDAQLIDGEFAALKVRSAAMA